ncbi:GRAM domain-containing protein 2B isoform X2 [Pristis pectinata]|uniref:GRAM domain-containing protein 2B isoform X2 n=1 Tax=Pristis pectinata TaxID=685728 RepID=UPI00223CFCDF|nr:GRAM domain-containing protein 2B isoform X2 [Pristis pectinata]
MIEQSLNSITEDEQRITKTSNKKDSKNISFNSEPENAGVEEKTKKSGKLLNQQLQSLNLDAEIFETKRKTSLTRSKTYDAVFPSSPTEYETKLERKKNSNPSKTNAIYHKIFKDIEKDESLKQSFTCALQKDILYQGKLFVSENWICFNSKVFGRDIKITIPTFSVTQIKKHKTALLVPNALCISTELEKFMFVSLLSRDTTYKLLKSVCLHLEERSDDISSNPSLAENNFRAERPTSLPLEFNIEDLPDLPTVCRRRELEQSSSSGSQTPESENSQEFTSATQALLKMEKNAIPVHADVHIKEMSDVKRSFHESRHSLIWGLLHKMRANGKQHLSVNNLLVLYLVIVIVLVFSSFYMGMKIFALEQRLASLGALPEYHAHHKDSFIQRDMGLPYQVNTDAIYDELTENLAKLEKIQKNLQKLLEGTE